ncbi:hypothetical protein K438DRAFT_768949 [Mycena galopus ATCC 62051]|nr:hypothetical protein K438DRAFT_768949 [Mycena galopus ATCC 62051]
MSFNNYNGYGTESAPMPPNLFLPAIHLVKRHSALKVLALCSSPRAGPDSSRVVAPGPWKHIAELEYIGPNHPSIAAWNDLSIVTYLAHTAITIPPRSDSRSDPWVAISSNDGNAPATLPRGYRIPLLWIAKVQWESLQLLLTVARPLWDLARNEPRIKRQWRDPMFDRALTRFFNGWMGCSEMFIYDFYREFKDEEYKDDLLARRWAQKVPKGIRGYVLTEEELVDGITMEQFMAGLVINRENSTFEWTVEPEVEQPPVTDPQPPELPLGGGISRREDEKEPPRTANSRGSSPLTSEQGSDIDMIAESLNPKASASTSTSEPPTPLLTRPESISTRAPPPPPIQTGSELPRKKSHKAKSRSSKTDRPDKASRPIRTRTSSSISAMSPATPKIAHLSRSDMSSAASSPNRTPSGFDFTAPIESRGRKRKIESVYSVSPSPLTSDSEDEDESSTGKGSTRGPKNPNRPSSRPVQSATPDGRAFTMNSRIVIPRLSNPEVYSRPQTSMYPVPVEGLPTSTASTSGVPSVVIKTPRKASTTSETPSPRKVAKSPVVPLHHYKLYAISSSPSTNPFDPTNPATSIPPFHNWRHPDELAYIGPSHPDAGTWTDVRVVTYMVDNAFSIPSRNADSKQTWVEVRVKVDGGEVVTTTLPRGYRIPLLWLGKVQWDCLKLLLTTGRDQWPALRFDVLHIARLAAEFMAKARKEVKMKRQYRNVMFDRALSRFFNGWMGSRDEFVWDFYREFRDEEYEDDMLQRRWLQKAVKGIQGFAVTEHELHEGITAEQFMEGLNLDRERGTYEWIDPDAPAAPSSPVPAIEEAAAASPMTMEPEPFPVIEPAPQPQPRTQTVPAAEPLKPQSTLRVEVAPRGHSPLSLSQVAGVRSASSSPLTPVFVDHHMDVDPPAQPQEQEQPAAVSAAAVAPAVVESPPPSDLLPEPEQVQTEQQSSVVVNDAAEPLATPEALADSGQLPPVQVFPSVQSSEIVNHAEPLVTREPSPVHVQLGPDGVPGAAAPSVPEPAPPAAEDNATERPAPIDDEPPAPRRWTSPLRSATPSAIDDGVGAEDVPMEDADVVGTPLPSLDLDEQAFHGPSNANNNMNMDDMDGLDELEADFIRYTPPPKTESAIRNPFLLGPQPVPHPAGLLGSTNSLIQPQPQEEEDVDFNEADYIRSRLPSPFAATPPAQSLQPESPKPRAMSPLAEPAAMSPLAQPAPTSPLAEPVAMSPLTEPAAEPVPSSPRPASPHSESIRSSSSPEPRHPELPEQSEPQSRGSVPPEGEDATEHRLPSLPPDSDEEGPAPEPVQANEPVVQVDEPVVQVAEPVVQVDEPTADDPAQINELAKVDDAPAAATVQTTERPTEQGAANATVATQAPAEVEVAHIVPLSPADAIDDFPPGFHFMGMPHGTPLQSNLSQTLFSQPSQDAAAAAPSQTQSAAQNNGSHPSDVVQVRPTAEVSRASASPSNADRAQSLVVDAPLTTRLSPETVSAETVLSTLKHNDDSKRVKLEIMTVSLSNGKNGTVEDEEDMDIETPIDVDMEGSLSPPPVSAPSRVASPPSDSQSVLPPSRMASPPLSASQSLFTPDTTPRSANTSAATFSNAARIAAANLASHLASPSISAGRAASSPVSQQSNDEMVAPGLSSIGRPSFPMHDANNFRRTPTPNRSPSLAGPGVRLSAPPMASLNGHRNSSATGRPSPTQNMSGNHSHERLQGLRQAFRTPCAKYVGHEWELSDWLLRERRRQFPSFLTRQTSRSPLASAPGRPYGWRWDQNPGYQ